jgi:deazaflavin-dependent oxidoreductase (nitroreductase family)
VASRPDFSALNQKVIDEFRSNGGEVAFADLMFEQGVTEAHDGRYDGTTFLILHHTGAKSGIVRQDPLSFRRVGNDYAVFATAGGSSANPAWYYNVLAYPKAKIEVGTDTFDVTARVAGGEERDRLWAQQKEETPRFGRYESLTTRPIPVVILEVD